MRLIPGLAIRHDILRLCAAAHLTTTEFLAVTLAYGLDHRGECSTRDVAEALGVTDGRVRQLITRALERLRAASAAADAPPMAA